MNEQPPAKQNNEVQPSFVADVFSGVGLGLLLGTVVGLSVTPVVSIVVGALASVLAVFLGLDNRKGEAGAGLNKIRLNGVRIGSFGLAAVLGIMLGLFVRAHQPFELPLSEHMDRWKGFPTELARQMVIYERTGLKPKTLTFVEGGLKVEVAQDDGPSSRSSVLVAGHTPGLNLCKSLEPGEWGNNPKLILEYYEDKLSKDVMLKAIGTQISALPANRQMPALEAARQLICQMQEGTS